MKKFLALTLILLMIVSVFVACGNEPAADDDKDDPKETTEAEAEKDANADDKDSASNEDKDGGDASKEENACTHTYDNACDAECNTCKATRTVTHAYAETLTKGETAHWYACSVCGAKKDETAHTFDKTVASSEYLKAEATTTAKAQYWKSCACGAKSGTEYFESNKKKSTLEVTMNGKTYDGTAVAAPTYTTNSSGSVTVEWYSGNDKLDAAPSNAGTYKVKVIVAENDDYAGISAEKEFTIAKAQAALSNVAMSSVSITYGDSAYTVQYSLDGTGDATIEYKTRGANDGEYAATKPMDVGTYTARVTIAEDANYLGTSATVDFEISPITLLGINDTVEYNGSNTYDVDLSDWGYSGVTLRVTFENKNVGAWVDDIAVLENDTPTNNYIIDRGTCTIDISKKTLGVQWTAPASLYFDGEEKIPTVTLIGLVAGDSCSADIEKEGDNVWFGETFKYRAFSLTGTDADNYDLPENAYSPEYTITTHESVTLGEAATVGAASWYDNTEPYTMYYSIELDAGHYYFDYTSENQGVSFVFELYAKGDTSTPIATYEVDEYSTISDVFEIDTDGAYYVKVVSADEGQYETLRIVEDEHDEVDTYGFCAKGCGTYLGETIEAGDTVVLSLNSGEKAYYRVEYTYGHLYGRSFASPLQSSDFAFYYKDGSGWTEIDWFNATPKDQFAGVPDDGYIYVVITAGATFENGSFTMLEAHDGGAYGFCTNTSHGYIGETINTNELYTDVKIKSGQKLYYRFAAEDGRFFNAEYIDKAATVTVTCYRYNDGQFIEQALTGVGTQLGATDGYYYLVFEYEGAVSQTFSFQIEKSNFSI